MDARAAGKAPLKTTCLDADANPVEVIIKDNHDGTYHCRYMPRRSCKHTITITWGAVSIPKAPFRVSSFSACLYAFSSICHILNLIGKYIYWSVFKQKFKYNIQTLG